MFGYQPEKRKQASAGVGTMCVWTAVPPAHFVTGCDDVSELVAKLALISVLIKH